jgi:hypothetical protein
MSQLKVAYVRGEMGDIAGQENRCYDSKLVSLEQALATIRPGSRIYLGTGCAAPRNLLAALEAMQPGPPDLEFVSFVTTSALPVKTGASQTRYRHRTFFVGSDVQSLAESGQLDYVLMCYVLCAMCRFHSRRCRHSWLADGCRSMWPCFRCPHPMPEVTSVSVCPSTSRRQF